MARLRRSPDAWLLRPGDLPTERHCEIEPRFRALEDNAAYRLIMYHRRIAVVGDAVKGLWGIPARRALDLRRAPFPAKDTAIALWAAALSASPLPRIWRMALGAIVAGFLLPIVAAFHSQELADFFSILAIVWGPSFAFFLGLSKHSPAIELVFAFRRLRGDLVRRQRPLFRGAAFDFVGPFVGMAILAPFFFLAAEHVLIPMLLAYWEIRREFGSLGFAASYCAACGLVFLVGDFLGRDARGKLYRLRAELLEGVTEMLDLLESDAGEE